MPGVEKTSISYDWVDANDNVVGSGAADVAMAHNRYTRSVHVWVMNGAGDVLVCTRSSSKKTYPSLRTSSAGGRVERGESYERAAARETLEELGISAPLEDAGRFDVINDIERSIHHLFIAKVITPKFTADPDEIGSFEFMSIKSIWESVITDAASFAPPFLGALDCFVRKEYGSLFIFDFDHTLFNWYKFKNDLEAALEKSASIAPSDFRAVKDVHELRDGLYNIYRHMSDLAEKYHIPQDILLGVLEANLAQLYTYIYEDGRALLERLSESHARMTLLTYGDRENQALFVERSGLARLFEFILFAATKQEKVDRLRDVLQNPVSVTLINDDPTEAQYVHDALPVIQRSYLVERSDAKYTSIGESPYYTVVRSLSDIAL